MVMDRKVYENKLYENNMIDIASEVQRLYKNVGRDFLESLEKGKWISSFSRIKNLENLLRTGVNLEILKKDKDLIEMLGIKEILRISEFFVNLTTENKLEKIGEKLEF